LLGLAEQLSRKYAMMAFLELLALPRLVFGPQECVAFWRFAASLQADTVGFTPLSSYLSLIG
jgi:hypothetical protein